MKLQQFNGGVSTRKAPHLIGINEGIVFRNIDIEAETLTPCKSLLAEGLTKTQNDRYISYEDDIITLAKTPTSIVEYQDKTYYSVDGDYIQMKDATSEGDLGLVPPVITNAININAGSILATPTSGDVTVTEVAVPGGAEYPNDVFLLGNTYEFALVHTGNIFAGVSTSAPYYFSHTVVGVKVALSFAVNPPYLARLYMKVAGAWTNIGVNLHSSDGIVDYESTALLDATEDLVLVYPTIKLASASTYSGATYSSAINISLGLRVADLTYAGAGGIFVAGEYNYVATVGISDLGWESAPSVLASVDVTPADFIQLEITTGAADSRVDTLSIYRIGDTLTDFTLVETVDNPVFPYTFDDKETNANIAGSTILATENHDKAISGLTNLAEVNGQLIGTYGSKLYFSEIGKLYAIPPINYRDFKNTLTGVFQIDAGLIVCSATKTWLMNTSNLATGRVIQLSDEFGCVGHKTMVGYKTGAMWASLAGLCISAGGKVDVITKDKVGYLDLQITRAVMHHEVYYGFTNAGVCYALDLRYNPAFMTYIFSTIDDQDANTEIRQVYVDGTELKVLFGAIADVDSYTVFGSSSVESLLWTSGKFIEGSYTEHKTYNDVYIRATAGLIISTLIDDKVVNTTEFRSTESKQIKLPQDRHQGYGIQFQASGPGEILEIEYKVMGRQNGR